MRTYTEATLTRLRSALTHIDGAIQELEAMRRSVRATGRVLSFKEPAQGHRPRTRLPAGRTLRPSARSDDPFAA
jgi:hypothetical protein